MNTSILSTPYFHNEEAAYEFVEARLWPDGPVCPRCKGIERISKMEGKSTRIGVYKCYECRKPFTVKVGTIFESSHIPLRLWLQAIFLVSSSKKGISANQLHRTLGITLKSAWFMGHRVREAMRSNDLGAFGNDGGIVEVDETFIGNDKTKPVRAGFSHKNKVLSLIDRKSKRSRSLVVDEVNAKTLLPVLKENISNTANVMTDDAGYYRALRHHFNQHNTVSHSENVYVSRENPVIHTNTIEGFFSVFKRGMKGVYQHCGHHHLNRYLNEFDFRYGERAANGVNDAQRADKLLKGVVGKRLTYQTTC